MTTPIRIGTTAGPFLKKTSFQADSVNGPRTTYVWEGTQLECSNRMVLERILGASSVNLDSLQNGNYQLTAVWGIGIDGQFGEPPSNVHELEIVQSREPIWISPILRDTLTDGDIAATQQIFNDYKAGNYKGASALTDALADIDDTCTDDSACEALFRQAAVYGVEYFDSDHSLYRRTITVGSPLQVRATFTGAGQIWTTADVLKQEQVPPLFFFALPASQVWLKSQPRVTVAAGQRTRIEYSYTQSKSASYLIYDKLPGGGAIVTDDLWVSP